MPIVLNYASISHLYCCLQYQEFVNALVEGGVELTEPEVLKPHYEPGIDFDNQYEVKSYCHHPHSG